MTINIVLMVGRNAPSRDSILRVERNGGYWLAYWDDGYCGCPDCHCIRGLGQTVAEAIADYWEQWEDRQ